MLRKVTAGTWNRDLPTLARSYATAGALEAEAMVVGITTKNPEKRRAREGHVPRLGPMMPMNVVKVAVSGIGGPDDILSSLTSAWTPSWPPVTRNRRRPGGRGALPRRGRDPAVELMAT